MVRKRKPSEMLQQEIGEMENQLRAAELAHADWIACAEAGKPGRESTNRSMIDRTLVARGVLGTVDAAMNAPAARRSTAATASSSCSATRRARASTRCRKGRRRRSPREPRSGSEV